MKTVHRLAPAGQATSLVILFHGYGADGADLIDLGHSWRSVLPNTLFVAPNAPTPCEMGGSGFQWWSIAQGLSPHLSANEAEHICPAITQFILAEAAAANVSLNRVALVGFSQGCMLALHVGLRLPTAPAAIVGYSGLLLPAATPPVVHPPVLLAHGMMDPVVPYMMMEPSASTLRQQGISVETLSRPYMAHSIDAECLTAGGTFFAKYLA